MKMEGDGLPVKDDSSFEVLSVCDEDDDASDSLILSSWQDDTFEIFPETTSPDARQNEEDKYSAVNNCTITLDLSGLCSSFYPSIETHHKNNLNISPHESKSEPQLAFSMQTNTKFDSNFGDLTLNENVRNPAVLDVVDVNGRPLAGISEETNIRFPTRPPVIMQNIFDQATFGATEKQIFCQRIVTCDALTGSQPGTVEWSSFRNGHQIIVAECEEAINSGQIRVSAGRSNCNNKVCNVMKQSLKVCKWFRKNKYIRNFLDGAKSSLNSFANVIEMELNQLLGINMSFKMAIIGNEHEAVAVEEAFYEAFQGQLTTSIISLYIDSVPVLPVGYNAALQTAHTKLQYARKQRLLDFDTVVISATTMIVETTPQRWQMVTLLCLDDIRRKLNLHNFTATTPIPNEYVEQAQRKTPETYPMKGWGLAVNIAEAIEYMKDMDSKDVQEFLTDVSHHRTIKSAAEVLAGMYIKYVTGSA